MRTLRGELVKDARPGRARNALIGVQVFASALLLISAAIFLRSAIASARFDPGFRTADTVLIDISSEPKRAAMARAVEIDATITAYAAVRPQLLAPLRMAYADTSAGKTPVVFKAVSGSWHSMCSTSHRSRARVHASERDHHRWRSFPIRSARCGPMAGEWARRSGSNWIPASAPGGFLTFNPSAAPMTGWCRARMVTVVGVARDVPDSAHRHQGGRRVSSTSLDAPKTSIVARVQGEPNLARQALLDRLTKIDPNMGTIITMRSVARLETVLPAVASGYRSYWRARACC
jgi:hypothetical protein